MTAYIGYPLGNRDMYLARVRAHRKTDTLIRGIGYQGNGDGRGCAIGCTLHSYDHAEYERQIGLPESMAFLIDWLFENLPEDDYLAWPERMLTAIRQGADLSSIESAWHIRTQKRNLLRIGDGDEPWRIACRNATETVIMLWAASEARAESAAANATRNAAWSAARNAAWSAAWSTESAAWSAAESAAWSTESAARSAAESAAESTAESAAESAEIQRQADDLIELLETASMTQAAQ